MNFFRLIFQNARTSLQSNWDSLNKFLKTLLPILGLAIFVFIGIAVGLDKKVITVLTILFGLISQAFIGLINIIALVPIVGPLIAKVLSLPIYWTLNALGYFLSIIAIKKGHSKSVVNYRILTIIFLVGVLFGFVLGRLI